METNEIVLYQPNETMKLEVRLEDETVWLTQQQIADLFGTKRPAITKHLSNIFKSGELDEESTCSILEHMAADGSRTYSTKYYNLDVILSVGYRVNSVNATMLILIEKWAGRSLKNGPPVRVCKIKKRRLKSHCSDLIFDHLLRLFEPV